MRTCRALFHPGQVAELRALGINDREGHTAAGWFDDFNLLAKAALRAEEQKSEGIYVTLNPANPACLARSPNKLKPFIRVTTSDKEIIRRQWLPIDLDPVRPSKISSSQAELESARETAKAIRSFLEEELRWPEGVRAFSSNGIHLLYKIDLPNDDDAKEVIRRCVTALSDRFSSDAVKIDTTVFNAARIWKLWGTLSRKGASITDRPHRRSFMWPRAGGEQYPAFEEIQTLSEEQIESLSSLYREPTRGEKRPSRSSSTSNQSNTSGSSSSPHVLDIDLDAFIEKHKIGVTRSEPWDGTGRRYILSQCIFDSSHSGTEAVLGKSPSGAVFYKCQHDSCASKRWADVKEHFEPRSKKRKDRSGSARSSSPREQTENAWELARDFIRDHYQTPEGEIVLRRHRDHFYVYKSGIEAYQEISADALKTQLTIWASEYLDKTTVRIINDVLHCVGANVTAPDDHDMPLWSEVSLGDSQPFSKVDMKPRRWISMKNGVLDIDALLAGKPAEECLSKPSSLWLNTVKLEYPFDITATCPRWTKFLSEIMEDDEERIAVIQEAFGYCLWDSTELERFFILVGSGQNGKSTTMNIMETMLGPQNTSSLSPSELEDKYMRADLYGKLANICTDMDDVDKFSEKLIKKICSGESIMADRKFKKGLSWRPRTKLFFATNMLPRFIDITQGIWRRAIILPFDVQIPNERKDTRLFEKLKNELPGIFLWAIQGMIRLLKNRDFTHSDECERSLHEYRRQCFPILTFLDEETEASMEDSTQMETLFIAYKTWCSEHGLTKPKPLHMFARDLYEFRPNVRRERVRTEGERKAMLAGLKLKRVPLT
jgi:P4 family phage/plasmid primase-like protien